MSALFDLELRARRRDRAARHGPALFLFDRAFGDCLERITLVQRRFNRALILGCPNPDWPGQLARLVDQVDATDPGALFARGALGTQFLETEWKPAPGTYDLILSIGMLDIVEGLPLFLRNLRDALRPDGLLLGALSGGETLPQLRTALRGIDGKAASPHVHPRIEASALAPLLSSAGFVMPVVDIDRAQVSYRGLPSLVTDLRRMGATNILIRRARQGFSRAEYATAATRFAAAANAGRTVETFEILHFAGWTPEQKDG
ncbi:methyltransferase domain-containing protein [Sphingomonas lutea]